VTTRSGSRIYRGVGRRRKPKACTLCFQSVELTATGRRRSHVDEHGAPCPGGGELAQPPRTPVPVDPAVIEQIVAGAFVHTDRWGRRRRDVPAGKWSGKP
jgi:hypothetical protein